MAPALDYEEPAEEEDALEAIGSTVVQSIMQQAGDYGRKRISKDNEQHEKMNT